ncbi:MAG: sirohydrochlorin cobaltochelatase [Lachnospiraceae bacterium]|nr:sirohydrochlorin cobaltochelatase [Lachnospiraceae bacterium]
MENRKKGLLVASFGTAHAETRAKTISLMEKQIQDAFPERKFYCCYTSPTVRRLMERREGIRTDGPAEALERMAADGMEDILIFVTHVIPGIESERIARQAEDFRALHPQIRVRLTKPLLSEDEDYRGCAGILLEEYGKHPALGTAEAEKTEDGRNECRKKAADETALIFFGHGTPHAGDACYERLEETLRRQWENINMSDRGSAEKNISAWSPVEADTFGLNPLETGLSAEAGKSMEGREQIYVITVEGSRTVREILPSLKRDGIKKALLIPFLLTAGEHVMHDMAGDGPGSVKSILLAEGIDAVCVTKGLGEYEKIREYYIQRYFSRNPL